jgi:hypothetical protein
MRLPDNSHGAGGKKQGILKLGRLELPSKDIGVSHLAYRSWLLAGVTALLFGMVFYRLRQT